MTIKASLEKEGVDVSKLKFIEVPFPDMNAALEAERVDGACVVEPFVSQGTAGKAKGINPFYVNTAPDLTVAMYFTSKQYAQENPEIIERFVTAMNKSLDYAQYTPTRRGRSSRPTRRSPRRRRRPSSCRSGARTSPPTPSSSCRR